MLLHPNAKINLGLNIVRRRTDGYHDIETIFYPIPLTDALTIEPAAASMFRQTGVTLDCNPADNLVVRAIRRYAEHAGAEDATFSVILEKNIPAGAGLGGGSSDAAFAMKAMRSLLARDDDDAVLERLLAPLGADCPFFVRNAPVFATGTGDIFTPISLSLAGWHIALVRPDIHVATREAYAAVHPAKPAKPLTDIIRRPVEEWQQLMVNDFEASVFAAHPEIGAIKARLLEMGATYASMSGSGSAVYALFKKGTLEPDLATIFPTAMTWWGTL